MSSDTTDDRSEDRAPEPDNAERVSASRPASRRGASKTRRPQRASRRKSEAAPDDPGERLREQAAEIFAATRQRIVERPVQAVLVAAAAGAFAALLLGAARR
ncbi:MAG: hypothetical protein QM741_10185 [Rudaea sp.]|uniref:hypothetical protein n=1 Tax=Rudaea sp. TaxID=2136325 RepID=UPI0039E431D1